MSMLKLAVNLSMIFQELPLLQRFAAAKAQGFAHVEIQFPYELSIETLTQCLAEQQLSLCLINVPAGDLMQGGLGLAGVPGREAEFSAALDQALDYATALKVPRINVLAGRQSADLGRAACLETLTRNLSLACTRAAQQQVQVVAEMINGINMPGFLIQDMAQGLELLTAVNHPNLKLQFDCYHMAMMGEDLNHCLREYMQHIGHIQFADCPGRHQPDTGEIDFAEFFQTITQSEYQGCVAAEYVPQPNSSESMQWKSRYFA